MIPAAEESGAARPLFVLLSGDLFFFSRVEAAARRAGAELATAASADEAARLCGERAVAGVLVDLSAVADVDAAVASVRAASPAGTAIVAYGPHVHAARLAAARKAGCDQVLSRGEFDAHLAAILAALLASQTGE